MIRTTTIKNYHTIRTGQITVYVLCLILNVIFVLHQSWSSNFEVYSASMLQLNCHSRITRAPRMLNDLETATFVNPEKEQFHIDRNDILHVYRNGSPKMNRHVKNLQ